MKITLKRNSGPMGPLGRIHGIPVRVPMGSQGGCPWDSMGGTHGIPWEVPMGLRALRTHGPFGHMRALWAHLPLGPGPLGLSVLVDSAPAGAAPGNYSPTPVWELLFCSWLRTSLIQTPELGLQRAYLLALLLVLSVAIKVTLSAST